MENMLVGISFSEQSLTVLKFALRLAQYHDCKLTFARILDLENEELNNITVPKKETPQKVFEAFRLKKEHQLADFVKEHCGKQFHTLEIDFEVRFGNIQEELHHLVNDTKADLLLVGKYTKTGNLFFSDTTNKLISLANCPVFIIPEDAEFQSFSRIVYASDFLLEDCNSIFFLLPWLSIFNAELICLHICKNQEGLARAKSKLAILNKIFPQENIHFRSVVYGIEKGIDRYIELSKSDMVATIHRDRNFWDTLFKKSMTKVIAKDVKVPMIIFQQNTAI